MKAGVSEKYTKRENKFLALINKLIRMRKAGLTRHEQVKGNTTIINKEDNLSAGHKKSRVVKICQNQGRCLQHFNCKPGNYENSQTSIDLWFYLSPQS